jgi:hypothetical protein
MSDSEIFKGAESWFSIDDSNNCTTLVKTETGGSLKKGRSGQHWLQLGVKSCFAFL